MRGFVHRWGLRLFSLGLTFVLIIRFSLSALDELEPFPIEKLEKWPRSILLTDQEGRVLLEIIGNDGYRRRPVPIEKVSLLLIEALVAVEDSGFWNHDGVDPIAICRAILQNLQKGKVFSGASTITMQVCRMIDDRPRNMQSKLIEAFRAWQLERIRSKREILEIYLNLIPCGGNIRGVESASRLFFDKSAEELSLPEAALIAGLPQSPDRYVPDLHPELGTARRNIVLWRMNVEGYIEDEASEEAMNESLQLKSLWLSSDEIENPSNLRGGSDRVGNDKTRIPMQIELTEGIQVMATSECSNILAFEERIRIDLRSLANLELEWFLNDQALSRDPKGALQVRSGKYILRCLTPRGESSVELVLPEPNQKE